MASSWLAALPTLPMLLVLLLRLRAKDTLMEALPTVLMLPLRLWLLLASLSFRVKERSTGGGSSSVLLAPLRLRLLSLLSLLSLLFLFFLSPVPSAGAAAEAEAEAGL
jgi:hypothetical protein